MTTAPLRILHVTESMATGVLSFIDSISRHQAAEGADVSVLYTVRPESPARDVLEARFDSRVTLRPAIDHGGTKKNAPRLLSEIARIARSGEVDVIHLHSSIAGGIGRLALLGRRTPTFYSPHGFGFLREDTSTVLRSALRGVERLLARRATLVLTSGSEMAIGRDELHAPAVDYLQSGVSRASILATPVAQPAAGRRLRVSMLGRIAYQKAPWRFAAVARELADRAEFLWVGGGDAESREKWIGDAPVTVLDWVTPDELEQILTETDILLFPTLWEGMSLSLIQAQGRGIPAVTTDVVGNRDAVDSGVTGYVCTTDAEIIESTRTLLDDADLRAQMSAAARTWALENFTDDGIGRDSIAIYRRRMR